NCFYVFFKKDINPFNYLSDAKKAALPHISACQILRGFISFPLTTSTFFTVLYIILMPFFSLMVFVLLVNKISHI
ncbi:MAG: hypothetical protein RR902_07340, partial [Oscillospiraceae bacterium]